jgi:hypothetical protein
MRSTQVAPMAEVVDATMIRRQRAALGTSRA